MSIVCPHCQASLPRARRFGRVPVHCAFCGQAFVAPTGQSASGPRRHLTRAGGSALAEAPTVCATAPPRPSQISLEARSSVAGSVAGQAGQPATAKLLSPESVVPGYRVERPLGHGGMGTVYLARQLSLDRPVALKVMSRKWTQDPVFVARFTREAFAAALLNHPNVVQIYDIGEHAGLRYFSMEYVHGRTLAELVKVEGRIDGETAVGYVLQAARGLAHAHDRGMIHRDVKPDNLLLDDQGRVKVADLGLVKTPESHADDSADSGRWHAHAQVSGGTMTGVRIALGTPAYMAPEQCRDAATVDHRADIYSLGCTLYVLVTGRPPFDGTTAVELMTKHTYEAIVPPEAIVGRVPKELSAVILKMLAKEPGDRFQSMGEVIRTLEQWLGVRHAGTFNPRDEQIDQLESCVRSFHQAPSAVTRTRVVSWGLGGCFLAAVLMLFFGRLHLAFGLSGFVIQSALAYFVLNGVREGSYFFRRVRAAVVSVTLWDYALALASFALFVLLLWGLGLLAVWAGFGALALAAAGAVHLVFDRAIAAERQPALAACRKLLRRMRLDGHSEDDLRLFVAKCAGKHWEEFFESLFGYPAKMEARTVLSRGHSSGTREKFAAWREPVLALIDRLEQARREAQERKFLEAVESAGLAAEGLSMSQAHVRAATQAEALLTQAGRIRGGHTVPDLSQMLGPHAAQASALPPGERNRGDRVADALTSPGVRALLAGLLIGLFAAWVAQNVQTWLAGPSPGFASFCSAMARPLVIPGVPEGWTRWVNDATVGWAGFLLLSSLFFTGPRTGALVMLGAAVAALGPSYGIHTVEPVRPGHVAFLLGSVFALVGYRLSASSGQ